METIATPLLGGMLLGLGLALPLVVYGYAEGASGMIHGLATGSPERRRFRLTLDGAMLLTGLACSVIDPGLFEATRERSIAALLLAGLLVGYGAKRANGCTSGHGVIGVGRGAVRSWVAISLFLVSATVVATLWPPGDPTRIEGASAIAVPAHSEGLGGEPIRASLAPREVEACRESATLVEEACGE